MSYKNLSKRNKFLSFLYILSPKTIAQNKGWENSMFFVHVTVFKYNLNQATNMHGYLKLSVHLHKKRRVGCILGVEYT